ncbi:AMP-binding protein [Aeromonas hydrophila]|uniref:AMP-binding protein n=1 Tax=Aeromonas hydrophila TaxID=644 RepID=UPI001F6055E2|nr:AMP-binding protein [Aeromonas hydrophila]UNU27792.1 AMP-binding protein [Aeromonas hydrophila]
MDHAHALLAHLREDNPAPAWRDPQEGWLSYGELARRVALLAASYPDERSLVYLPFFTRTAHLLHYLAALKQGHVVMLADPALPASQHDASCRQFGVSWRVNDAGQLERLAATTPTLHPELSVLLPTSGSTGSAKWVRLSGRNLAANATSIADYLTLTAAERAITSLPLYYSYGLSVLNSHLLVGASLVQHEGSVLERDFWQQVDLHGVSSFAGVPFTYQMLARLRFDWARYPSLQTLTQAGGRLEPALAQQFAEQALRLERRFFVMYGQTEATARMAWLAAPEVAAHPDAIGRAIPGGQFALRALEGGKPGEGELVYRGDNVMLGYAGTAEELAQGAQLQELATGDLARCDEAGRYYICGRLSRFLKLFGKRVSLAEVESQLHRWGWTGACGGRDDCLLVAVEPRGDQMADGLQRELAQWLQAPPRAVQVVQVTQLPRTANHKIDYAALARLAGEA